MAFTSLLHLPAIAQEELPVSPESLAEEESVTAPSLNLTTAIAQLQSDDYDLRQAASDFLLKNASVADLEKLEDSDDPEVSYRVNLILQSIRTGLTADTPAEIVALVNEFSSATADRKAGIIQELVQKNAFIPAFTLTNQLDKENPLHVTIKKQISNSTRNAVKYFLEQDQPQSALRITDLVEPAPQHARLWAFVTHTILDDAPDALEQLLSKENPDEFTKARVLALYRVMEDEPKAVAWATQHKLSDYLAGHALLSNDLPTFFTWWKQKNPNSNLLEEYLKSATLRSQGKIAEAIAEEEAFIVYSKKGKKQAARASYQLAAMGSSQAGFDLLPSSLQKLLSQHLTSKTDMRAFFKLYNLEFGKPVTSDWIKANIDSDTLQWWVGDTSADANSVAKVLAGLGDHDSLELLCEPLWEANLSNEGSSFQILQQLFRSGYKENAVKILKGLDEKKVDHVVKSLSQADDLVNYTFKTSKKIFAEKSLADHLIFTLSVTSMQISSDDQDELEAFIKAVEQDCLDNPDNLRNEARLAGIYQLRGDYQKVLSYSEAAYRKSPSSENARGLTTMYLFFDRYKDAAKVMATIETPKDHHAVGHKMSKAAIFKKAGLEKESQQLVDELFPETLSRPLTVISLAEFYASVGLYQEAAEVVNYCLSLSNPDEENYVVWATLLERAIDVYQKSKNFRKAALCGEALLVFRLDTQLDNASIANRMTYRSFYTLHNVRIKTNLNWIRHFAETGNTTAAKALSRQVAFDYLGNASLADDFYPLMRELGYDEILKNSIDENMEIFRDIFKHYPEAYMHYNGAAWLASRAVMHLDEARQFITKALESAPINSAYLDTMAEVYFASGDRPNALKYSLQAWQNAPGGGDQLIKDQYYHFKNDPLPNKE